MRALPAASSAKLAILDSVDDAKSPTAPLTRTFCGHSTGQVWGTFDGMGEGGADREQGEAISLPSVDAALNRQKSRQRLPLASARLLLGQRLQTREIMIGSRQRRS
jgi:hypothetical protein